jgi:hypothetical protein
MPHRASFLYKVAFMHHVFSLIYVVGLHMRRYCDREEVCLQIVIDLHIFISKWFLECCLLVGLRVYVRLCMDVRLTSTRKADQSLLTFAM